MSHSFKILFLGFLVGFVATFIATLGLVIRMIEILKPVLVPGWYIWNFVDIPKSILLLGFINGVVYATIFFVLSKLLKRRPNSEVQ